MKIRLPLGQLVADDYQRPADIWLRIGIHSLDNKSKVQFHRKFALLQLKRKVEAANSKNKKFLTWIHSWRSWSRKLNGCSSAQSWLSVLQWLNHLLWSLKDKTHFQLTVTIRISCLIIEESVEKISVKIFNSAYDLTGSIVSARINGISCVVVAGSCWNANANAGHILGFRGSENA